MNNTEVPYRKIAGYNGLLFVLLSILFPLCVPLFPPLGTDPVAIYNYYTSQKMPFLVFNLLAALAAIPGFIILSYLSALIRNREAERGWLWIFVLGSGIFAHIVGVVDLLFFQATAVSALPGYETILKVLSDLSNMGFGFFIISQLTFLISVSVAIRVTKVLPQWMAWLADASSAVSLIAILGTIFTNPTFAAGGLTTVAAFGSFLFWSTCLGFRFVWT